MGQMMRAVESFVAKLGSEELIVPQNEIADADHELVKRYPHLWEPLKARFVVEQATAGPGEARPAKVRISKSAEAE